MVNPQKTGATAASDSKRVTTKQPDNHRENPRLCWGVRVPGACFITRCDMRSTLRGCEAASDRALPESTLVGGDTGYRRSGGMGLWRSAAFNNTNRKINARSLGSVQERRPIGAAPGLVRLGRS